MEVIEDTKKNNITSNIQECCGCSACANICPTGAIKMTENEIGYYTPTISDDKCINCGKCIKVCPEINNILGNNKTPKVYACQSNDELRFVSSSGGMFTPIAEYVLSLGGFVVGVEFDKNWKVQHTIINNINDLDKLRRSKYVQSYIKEDLYKEIENLLKNDKYVLFTGCPCQVAGLKSYLNKKYEKLILVDLLCAQCASPKVYRKFLQDCYPNEEIKSINFRSKIAGWDANTVIKTNKHIDDEITYNFMKPYANHLLMNETCKHCKYTTTSRQGDLTIGDFWGIGKRYPELDDRKGTSCLLVNTEKGNTIFNKIKRNLKLCKELPLREAIISNWILQGSFPAHPNINMLNKKLETKNFVENVNDCLNKNYNIGIMGWFWVPNRGAILTNYALNEFLKDQGYNVKTINFIPSNGRTNTYNNSIAEDFANKYLTLTKKITNYNELKSLNKYFGTFIVGSDQLWRWAFRKYPLGHLFLNFANLNKKILSYSTSFGTEKYDGPEEARILRRLYLKRFDAISVREFDGVKILEEDFKLKGIQTIDPVFLVDKSKYEQLIKNSDKTDSNYIAYYFILPTEEKMNIVKMAEQKFGIKAIDIKGDLVVEDWLYYIKNCRILITDSFHGSCFATIFNKTFIPINVAEEKPTRFETLFKITNMMDRLLLHPNDIKDKEYLFDDINWTEANRNLEREINRSQKWLLEQIEYPQKDKLTEDEKIIELLLDRTNNININYNKNLGIVLNRKKIYFKYYLAKLCFNLTWGNLRNKYKQQKYHYKPMIRILREIKKTVA